MVKISHEHMDPLKEYRSCENCSAPLSELYLGGVGDWRTTIMCCRCHHVRDGVDFERVLIPLIAERYGLTREDARAREEASQEEYLRMVAEQSDLG